MRWLEKARLLLAANKRGELKTLIENLEKRIRFGDSSCDRRTVDELIDLAQPDFKQMVAKPEPTVYVYRYADLPIELSPAEIAASSRRRLSPEPTE